MSASHLNQAQTPLSAGSPAGLVWPWSATAGAIAFLVPKIIDALTPDGFAANALPPQASRTLIGRYGRGGPRRHRAREARLTGPQATAHPPSGPGCPSGQAGDSHP